MPRDLPGFYWDAERNRYFPLSSRPSGTTPSGPSTQQTQENPPKKRKLQNRSAKGSQKRRPSDSEGSDEEPFDEKYPRNLPGHGSRRAHVWSLTQSLTSQPPSGWSTRERIIRKIRSCCIGNTSRLTYNHAPIFGEITTFCTFNSTDGDRPDGPGRWHLLGDSRGWLFRCKASYRDHDQEEFAHLDSDIDSEINWLPWSAELNLQPHGCVSSVSMWGSRWVATGAGSSARFASSDIRSLDRMFIVTLPAARDLWASHLRDRSVAFGASFRAIYVPDIDHSTAPEQLNTHSDVFTVTQDQNLIYTGSRNGSIHRFDKRVGFKGRGDLLLDSRFPTDQRTSVLGLSLLGSAVDDPAYSGSAVKRSLDFGLLVSQMNGQLQTFDLRYISSKPSGRGNEPIVVYDGHVNTHTRELGLAIDHTTDFLYAAGQDCRIRGWSLITGEPIVPSPSHNAPSPTFSSSSSIVSSSAFASSRVSLSSGLNNGAASSNRPPTLLAHEDPWSHTQPFSTTFSGPIPVLRVSSEDCGFGNGRGRGNGRCLWAAGGEGLWRWNLGQRSLGGGF